MKSIIIADDSASMRQMIEFTLGGAGYKVHAFPDGEAAAQAAQSNPVDMLITDLNMPRKNGIELIESVRSGGGPNASKPIIMLTTESDPAKKQQGKAAGATGWIVKPFDSAKLIAVVQKVLR